MHLVLCHTTADFDTLGAAIGVTLLQPGTQVVLAGGCHPSVKSFLALHRDEYPLMERRAINIDKVDGLTIVDAQALARLGPIADWVTAIAQRQGQIVVYDHHDATTADFPATERIIDAVGAATTLVVEQLQTAQVKPTIAEATVMALGIHADTGSLTFTSATPRDAAALAWLMAQGASQAAIAEFVEPNLSPTLQRLSETAIAQFQRSQQSGYSLGWTLVTTADYVPGLSSLAERLITFLDVDCLLFGATFRVKDTTKLVLIGRARGRIAQRRDRPGVDFGQLFAPLGGGGHATAASATCAVAEPQQTFQDTLRHLQQQIPPVPTAADLMSSPVRTIRPQTTIEAARRILLRYGHSGLSVVNASGTLVGVISRRDIDLALHHGFGHAPVKGYMTTAVKTIAPTAALPEIEALMVTYDVGRLPVLDHNQLVGIVTRTDVLRQLHWDQAEANQRLPALPEAKAPWPKATVLWSLLEHRLGPERWTLLQKIAQVAQAHRWHLYLVGGGVRDLLLSADTEALPLQDIDLVVDSAYQSLEMGAGVVLAEAIKAQYPAADLQVYGRFQTAALIWHQFIPEQGPLMVDIATARTEFYPYPAANPEVEVSSIRQDLYRRDFTINALAICLTSPHVGKLLDFFGGAIDLQQRYIRVLHANSFIEDPTRIYRAVRFAVRLDFAIEPQTETFIRYAIDSGVYRRLQAKIAKLPALQARLKTELKYILEAAYWEAALSLLNRLGALVCLHPELAMDDRLWRQLRRLTRWIERVPALSTLISWQMRLELIIATLADEYRATVAINLQLPQITITRLTHLQTAETEILALLPQCDRPSESVRMLQNYDLGTLILVTVRHPQRTGDRIWRYITQWSQVVPILNGNDLRQLGYRPGPRYRPMLEALQAATLDGEIQTSAQAIAFLQKTFPLPDPPT